MLALYRAGRQADALEACRTVRQRLDEELGIAPGQALSELETAILRHDAALELAPWEAGSEPTRAEDPPGLPPQPPSDALFDVVRRVPMVGRAGEYEQLRWLWGAVCGGERRVALVSGEAGVGKTRLVAELASEATGEGTVLVGAASRHP